MENEDILESIERLVFDEDKIVTYKWISKNFNIHVNISKRLLLSFTKNKEQNVGVSYVISGIMPDGTHRITVVQKKDLSNVKGQFKTVTSEHVYSVQRNTEIKDLNVALYAVEKQSELDCNETLSWLSIKCEGDVLRNSSDLNGLRKSATVSTKSKVEPTKTVPKEVKKTNAVKETSPAKKANVTESPKKSNDPKKPGGIASLFAAQKDSKKSENAVNKKDTNKIQSKPKGLASFFDQNQVKKKDNKNDVKKDETVCKTIKEDCETAEKENVKSPANTDVKIKENNKSEKDNKIEQKSKSSSSKGKDSKKGKKRKKTEEDNAKKRKRIVMWSDSEESEEEEDNRSLSPEREPTPPPPAISDNEDDFIPGTPQEEVKRKRKKRKLVEKTFMDSEGFLVTNKEYAVVSASEDEEDVKDKEEPKPKELPHKKAEVKTGEQRKETKNKKSPVNKSPQKSKQSSIMSFFARKN